MYFLTHSCFVSARINENMEENVDNEVEFQDYSDDEEDIDDVSQLCVILRENKK